MDRAEKAENKPPVYCSFTDASGVNCEVEAKAESQFCEVHVKLPGNSSTQSGTRLDRGAKKADSRPKRKVEDSSPGEEMIYYAGWPGLRRKRGSPRLESEATPSNHVDE